MYPCREVKAQLAAVYNEVSTCLLDGVSASDALLERRGALEKELASLKQAQTQQAQTQAPVVTSYSTSSTNNNHINTMSYTNASTALYTPTTVPVYPSSESAAYPLGAAGANLDGGYQSHSLNNRPHTTNTNTNTNTISGGALNNYTSSYNNMNTALYQAAPSSSSLYTPGVHSNSNIGQSSIHNNSSLITTTNQYTPYIPANSTTNSLPNNNSTNNNKSNNCSSMSNWLDLRSPPTSSNSYSHLPTAVNTTAAAYIDHDDMYTGGGNDMTDYGTALMDVTTPAYPSSSSSRIPANNNNNNNYYNTNNAYTSNIGSVNPLASTLYDSWDQAPENIAIATRGYVQHQQSSTANYGKISRFYSLL